MSCPCQHCANIRTVYHMGPEYVPKLFICKINLGAADVDVRLLELCGKQIPREVYVMEK